MELHELTAPELAEQLRVGAAIQAGITAATAGRIAACQPGNNAFITVAGSPAPAPALSASPLAGVPIAYKDALCTRGIYTTCASKILRDFTPCHDAVAIERLTATGAMFMGKLNLDESAMGSICETFYYGPTKNPQDFIRSPDGSFSGAAVAVAAGEVWYAIGPDTGGSVRQPTTHCSVTGMKPTYGSVSWYDLVAYASSLGRISPITRFAADCATVLELICGRDPRDANSPELPVEGLLYVLTGDVRDRRIGLPTEHFDGALEPEVTAAVRAAAGMLRTRGAVAEECSLPLLDYAVSICYILTCAKVSPNLVQFDGVKYGWRTEGYGSLEELYHRTRTEGFGLEVKRRILLGTFVLSAGCYGSYYKETLQARIRLEAVFDAVFQRYDLLLTPATPITVPRLGKGLADSLSLYLSDIYTAPANLAGLLALPMLCGFDRNGLPIGAQLIDPALGNLAVLDTTHAYQQETSWHCRHPNTPASAKGGGALRAGEP